MGRGLSLIHIYINKQLAGAVGSLRLHVEIIIRSNENQEFDDPFDSVKVADRCV